MSWTGKAERTSFDVDTVSLHVHERIDPASILSALRKKVGAGETAKDKGKGAKAAQLKAIQPGLFDAPFESLPLRDAIDFYKHDKGWSNRLVAGDSLLVMNSLLQKEGMAGQVQMIYHRPALRHQIRLQLPALREQAGREGPQGRRPDARTGNDQGVPRHLGTGHSLLPDYLRDRLLLAKELLNEIGQRVRADFG